MKTYLDTSSTLVGSTNKAYSFKQISSSLTNVPEIVCFLKFKIMNPKRIHFLDAFSLYTKGKITLSNLGPESFEKTFRIEMYDLLCYIPYSDRNLCYW